MAHCANLKELARLGLNTLCGINDHNGTVRSHQGAVGVLREILMARGIQNVNAKTAVLELHDRGGNGNTSLLFDFHPVGGGGAGIFLPLTTPAWAMAPPYSRNFSVNVVLPASGWEMMANVRRRLISSCKLAIS